MLNKILNAILFLTILFLTLPPKLNATIGDIDPYFLEKPDKTISMDFKSAALNDVLKLFSQQSGLNFIASTDVSDQTINLYLENVPVELALERILFANGLTYELTPESNIFVVKKLAQTKTELTTRVYTLKHATVQSSKITTQMESSDKEGGTEASTGAGGLIEAIKAILTSDGKAIEDPRSNSIIVTDIPSQFQIIEQTIARLDVRIPQILIEVEMLDISKNTADLMGVKFGDTPFTFKGAEKDSAWPFVSDYTLENHPDLFKFEDTRYRVSTMSFSSMTLAAQFLRSQGDTRSLARPRILTLNNETAQIEISTDETIGIIKNTDASEGVANTSVEAERTSTGVFLKVTPQANLQTGEILMAVEPRVIQAREGAIFDGFSFKDPEERKTKSILRIIDGDTIIIGGLLRTDVTDSRSHVPILGKIPFLGAAFRHKDKSETERELIIFLTPHILKETVGTFNGNIQLPTQRERSVPNKTYDIINQELQLLEENNR